MQKIWVNAQLTKVEATVEVDTRLEEAEGARAVGIGGLMPPADESTPREVVIFQQHVIVEVCDMQRRFHHRSGPCSL